MSTRVSSTDRVSANAQLRFTGEFSRLSAGDVRALFQRVVPHNDEVIAATAAIIADVRAEGDAALRRLAKRFDGVELSALEVPRARVTGALDTIDPALRRAMERSAANIAHVHRAFAPLASETEPEPGIVVGRRPDPLARVGVYAPGGRASYPSSVLMTAIPAREAGVGEVVLCAPPDRSGFPAPTTLAAAAIAGVDRVFSIGGAGAIAAMALGTESVPRVDRVVGPGNAYVAAAKLQLVGEVGIDSPAGPSELVVIADGSCHAAVIAGEMVAQAEHDPDACVVAAVVGAQVAIEIERELAIAIAAAPRRAIVEQALRGQGGILVFSTVYEAIAFSNAYAPEHLLLAVNDAISACRQVRNSGSVFVGETSSVAYGDYMTGGNHVLPTAGAARIYSGLSPLDFVRWTTYQRVTRDAAARLAPDVGIFADAEALPSHAAAARRWAGGDR